MRNRTLRVGRVGALVVLTGGILVLALQPRVSSGQAAAAKGGSAGASAAQGPVPGFVKLGFKFDGANSCSNVKCHGAAEPTEGSGATTLAEFTQWSADDPHKKAHETLGNDESAAIAEKLKIKDATTDARCTSCHAIAVPANLQGKEFELSEGVSCAACHGPSGKWLDPHDEKGWTEKQRTALKTPDALLKQWGLYDTKDVLARANMCTSCHLAIDAEMVAAGHPVPVFELDIFSRKEDEGGFYPSQHWREPAGDPFYHAQLWSTGQAVALRDAMLQLARRAGAKQPNAGAVTDAYTQAMAHYSAFKPVLANGVVKGDVKAWDKAAAQVAGGIKGKKMADVAAGAKAIAAEAAKVAPVAATSKFDKAKTLAVLKALLADQNTAKAYGGQGMEQQAYAVYALWNVHMPKGGEKVATQISETLFPPEEGEMTAAEFSKNLAAVAKQVK